MAHGIVTGVHSDVVFCRRDLMFVACAGDL